MQSIRTLIAALVVVAFLAQTASAATNKWSDTYPKTGPNEGEILVKGTATPDACWVLEKEGLVSVWAAGPDGGLLKFGPITVDVDTGVWKEHAIPGLKSGQLYFVVIQVTQVMGMTKKTIYTAPATATAK